MKMNRAMGGPDKRAEGCAARAGIEKCSDGPTRHSRESGNPAWARPGRRRSGTPAFAGVTEKLGPLPMKLVVVGAGYSGTMAAVEAERACPAAEVSLVERRGRFAAGAAYSTTNPSHLLNVRARSMSAFADAPDDFASWLERQGLGGPETFARRRDYARYLAEILERSETRRIDGEAVAVEGKALVLASGDRLAFDALVLAGGNYPGPM